MQKSKEILEYCDSILEFTLRDSLSELRHKNRNEYVSKCNTKYPEFFKRYPALFFKIIDNPNGFKNNGRKRLLKFLNIKEDIDLKKISHEEASKNIGRKLLNNLEESFKNKGYNNINLVTNGFQAAEFYKKCGFKFLGLSKLEETTGLPAHYKNAIVSLFEIKL